MNRAFVDYYRCPETFATFDLRSLPSKNDGYFRFGPDAICYGRCYSKSPAEQITDALGDALHDVTVAGKTVWLPFNPSEIVDNLRFERYASPDAAGKQLITSSLLRGIYYTFRPLLSVSVRRHLQRMHLRHRKTSHFPSWPLDSSVEHMFEALMLVLLEAHGIDSIPFIWFWPDGLPACTIMTHDVESTTGRDLCSRLMDLDDSYGIKSSFQIVPERRYAVSQIFLDELRQRGFEINIHDLDHDGRLFSSQELFLQRAQRINRYGEAFGAEGFRSAILYRNVEWLAALDFAYDMSVPSVGSFEAQAGGCCSATPFFIGNLLELPVTTTQDYCLFHILNQYSIDLWKRQLSLISERHGLASFIIHPDYIFESGALATYHSLLTYLASLRSDEKVWIAQPREVNAWWRARSLMRLVPGRHGWRIEGDGKERARIAYASRDGNRLVCRVAEPCQVSASASLA